MLNPDFLKNDNEELPYEAVFKNKIRLEKIGMFFAKCNNERNYGRSSLIKYVIESLNGNEFNDEEKAFFTCISIEKALVFAAMQETGQKALKLIIENLENQDDFDFDYPDKPETIN